MIQRTQGRARAWQWLIGSAFFVCAHAGLVSANDFSQYPLDTVTDDYRAYKPNEVLVRFDASTDREAVFYTKTARWNLTADRIIAGSCVKKDISQVVAGLALIELPPGMSVIDAVSAFNASGKVVFAEPNYRLHLAAAPSDPRFITQWALDNGDIGDINLPEGWDIKSDALPPGATDPNEAIIVAVVDTGVDFNHPDLYQNIMILEQGFVYPADANLTDPNSPDYVEPNDPNFLFFDHGIDVLTGDVSANDPNDLLFDGEPRDNHYHGTMVAGIIGAVANNDEGIAGVANRVRILVVRVTDSIEQDGQLGGNVADAVTGIGLAMGSGAHIINLSWTVDQPSIALQSIIDATELAGVLVVAAAGNGVAFGFSGISYPAAFLNDNIISVMATDSFDQPAPYSNFDPLWVDLAAPGGATDNNDLKIISTTPQVETAAMAAEGVGILYDYDGSDVRGTSFAAAHVSGACALALAMDPNWTPTELRQIITHRFSVDRLDSLAGRCVAEGRLNLAKFLWATRPGTVTNETSGFSSDSTRAIQAVIDHPETQPGDTIVLDANRIHWEALDFGGKNLILRSDDGEGELSPENTFVSSHLDDFLDAPTISLVSGEDASTRIEGLSIIDGGPGILIDAGSGATISHCIVTENLGSSGGGLAILANSSVLIEFSEIVENMARQLGAGIYLDQSSLRLIASDVNDNHVSDFFFDGRGGGLASVRSSLWIEDCNIVNNSALLEGGGAYLGAGDVNVTSSFFSGNLAGLNGGALFIESDIGIDADILLSDLTLDRNTADFSGGAIAMDETENSVTVRNCLITNNVTRGHQGGGLYCYRSSPTLSNLTMTGNDCQQLENLGGAIYCEQASSPVISDSIFYDNNDVAVAASGATSVPVLSHCVFYANFSGDYVDDSTGIVILRRPLSAVNMPGSNIIHANPLFVSGRLGDHYLSNFRAGQILNANGEVVSFAVDPNNPDDPNGPAGATSPAVDAGSQSAVDAGLNLSSTRTDNSFFEGVVGDYDDGILDIGFHYSDLAFLSIDTVQAVPSPPGQATAEILVSPGGLPPGQTELDELGSVKRFAHVVVKAAAVDPDRYLLTSWEVQAFDPLDPSVGSVTVIPAAAGTTEGQIVFTMAASQQVRIIFQTAMVRLEFRVYDETGSENQAVGTPNRVEFWPRGYTRNLEVEPREGTPHVEWTGADNDFSRRYTNKVTMEPPFAPASPLSDIEVKIVSARLFTARTLELRPGGSLDETLASAQRGDVIRIYQSATPYYTAGNLVIAANGITIRSERPDDPNVVARTIIELRSGGPGFLVGPAFTFFGNIDRRTLIEGLTIRGFSVNGVGLGQNGAWDSLVVQPPGVPGGSAYGAAIRCLGGSPTLRNLVFEDLQVQGQDGGDGVNGDVDFSPFGQDGGWPGVGAGGAIACLIGAEPNIVNCVFRNCRAFAGDAGDGGDGVAGFGGGAAGAWTDNVSRDSQAANYPFFFTHDLSDFDYRSATGGVGGAVYIDRYSSPRFEDCRFENCFAQSGVVGAMGIPRAFFEPSLPYAIDSGGGAVYIGGDARGFFAFGLDASAAQAEFIDCNFTSNFGLPASGTWKDALTTYGGAVAASRGTRPLFRGCTFSDNLATVGGAIYAEGSALILKDSLVENNTGYHGGGVYIAEGSALIDGSTIRTNTAEFTLDYLADPNHPLNVNGQITPGLIDANATAVPVVVGDGGGLLLADSATTVKNSLIYENVATSFGGGMHIVGSGRVSIENSLVRNNVAGKDGGGISATNDTRTLIRNSTITGNVAADLDGLGGGLFVGVDAYVSVIDSIIWKNSASPGVAGNAGDQIAVGTGPRDRSQLTVRYSDIGPLASVSDANGQDPLGDMAGVAATLYPADLVGAADPTAAFAGLFAGAVIPDQDFLNFGTTSLTVEAFDLAFGIAFTRFVASYGIDGWVGADGQNRIVVYDDPFDPNISARGYVFVVTVPDGNDPAMHPLSATNPGPLAPRTFTEERQFALDVNAPLLNLGSEFYADSDADIYLGVDPNSGIRHYQIDPTAFNAAAFGPLGNYVFVGTVADPIPGREFNTWSLAHDPNANAWYALAEDPNDPLPTDVEVWRHLPIIDPNGIWELAFTYTRPPKGRDRIEFVDGGLMVINPRGDTMRKYSPSGALLAAFGGTSVGTPLALGHGAFEHYWVSTGFSLVELGGSFLQTGDQRFEDPILVNARRPLQGWDPNTGQWDAYTGNIMGDPLFVDDFFLSQISAGEADQSPAVDAGSAPLGDPNLVVTEAIHTTRTDGTTDMGLVDMGYHHPLTDLARLDVLVLDVDGEPLDANETAALVTGGNRFYLTGSVATLQVSPDAQIRPVWSGTIDDTSVALTNSVLVLGDTTVTIRLVPDLYRVSADVVGGGGTVEIIGVLDPNTGLYFGGDLQLVAHPGLIGGRPARVKQWTGIPMPVGQGQEQVSLVLDSNLQVRVEFEPDVVQTIMVPHQYSTIEAAVSAAQGPARIIVDEGVHAVSSPAGIDFGGKQITLMSRDPDNPAVVAATIIDAGGGPGFPRRAFHFQSGEDANAVVTGFTIRNGHIEGFSGAPGRFLLDFIGPYTPEPYEIMPVPNPGDNDPPRAERGRNAEGVGFGGSILCENGSSPKFVNCIIEDNTVTGGRGGDGAHGFFLFGGNWNYRAPGDDNDAQTSDGQWGGHGGAGSGTGHGGGVACLGESHPTFVDCTFRDNVARGGVGGAGGNGGFSAAGNESGGGNGGSAFGAGFGGAAYADGTSSPRFVRFAFSNNIATSGHPGAGGLVGPGTVVAAPRLIDTFPGFRGSVIPSDLIPSGGALYFDDGGSTPLIEDCAFVENKAWETHYLATSAALGGIPTSFWSGSFYELRDAKTHVDTRGGAIYCDTGTVLRLDRCTFDRHAGGTVYASQECSVDVNDCRFTGNVLAGQHEPHYPGIDNFEDIYFFNGFDFPILDTAYWSSVGVFAFQQSAYLGAAIYVGPDCDPVLIQGTQFNNNRSLEDGGAIHFASNATVRNCSFAGNRAFKAGGAINAGQVSGGIVQSLTVDPNTGQIVPIFVSAPTLQVEPEPLNLTLEGCTFSGNRAADQWYVDTSSFYMHRYRDYLYAGGVGTGGIDGDSGEFGFGGALHAKHFDVSATGCQIIANRAKNGAGIYVRSGSLALNGGLVSQNVARGIDALIPIGDVEFTERRGINKIT
ncbi:MAG: right-handed parallel beta-helix repeat-containing protein [Planctomycetes bacterium]|nr:right-handed parallel beta-helix repeat-containing protein [Planctomycetota bacterium]